MLVYQALSQTIVADVSFLSENEQDKWLLFCQQFRAEMDGSSVKKIENNRLYSEKDGKLISIGYHQKWISENHQKMVKAITQCC